MDREAIHHPDEVGELTGEAFEWTSLSDSTSDKAEGVLRGKHHSLRFQGLLQPENALDEVVRFFQNDVDRFPDKLQKLGIEEDVVPEVGREKGMYCSPVFLIFYDPGEEFNSKLKNYGLEDVDFSLYKRLFSGYYFSHAFVRDSRTDHKTSIRKLVNTIKVDSRVVHQTLSILDIKLFEKFQKALASFFLLANHDYSMHNYGLGVLKGSKVRKILTTYFDFNDISNGNASGGEFFAALFHKDMLCELCETYPEIEDFIFSQLEILLGILNQIDDSDIVSYWKSVIKYPLYSARSPNSERLQEVLQKYDIDLKPNTWSHALDQDTIKMRDGRVVSVRDLREVVMKDLYTTEKEPNFTRELLQE